MVDATYDLPFAVSRSRWLYHKVLARSHLVTLLASNLRFAGYDPAWAANTVRVRAPSYPRHGAIHAPAQWPPHALV